MHITGATGPGDASSLPKQADLSPIEKKWESEAGKYLALQRESGGAKGKERESGLAIRFFLINYGPSPVPAAGI